MFIYNWLYPKGRIKKNLIISLGIIQNTTEENNLHKRIISIARRLGYTNIEITEIIEKSKKYPNMISSDYNKRYTRLYEFIKFISELNEVDDEYDLCIEIAVILGYDYQLAPSICREILNGILTGTSEDLIRERIKSIIDKKDINLSQPLI